MPHRDAMPIDGVGRDLSGLARNQMGNDLVAEKIEIDPVCRTPSFRAAKRVTVEMPCSRQVVDRYRQMKRGYIF